MIEDLHDNQKNLLEEAVEQFVDAQLQGREPVIDEFVKKYPKFEDQVRIRIRKLKKIDTLFASLIKADESDFGDAAAEQYLVGRKVGSFEITEMIGRGGMGVVYLAHDTKLKRSVAIKSMPAKLATDATARTRFRREAELLASLNHPNIGVIYDIVEQDESAGYLILEYVEGETLAERMARAPFELDEALSIGRQVAEAISAAHTKGVIHRDLKPSNIKITPEGRVKVLDFGLAKAPVTQGKKEEITETQPGRVIGTPAYMSPEQARGNETDHRTDIWSFGCMMYQMLAGRLPFEGETATDTLARIIEREPDWNALPQVIPANIRTLLRRCLEKDPNERLGNIADANIQINETLSKPAIASAVTIPLRLRRKAKILGAVAVGVILCLIALKFIVQKEVQPSLKEIRLVVLPFENLGFIEDAYLADGITDAITVRLGGIHGLGVISRQSAMQYKDKEKSTQQIAEELDVDYILEGTVQRERPSDPNSGMRITPQLVRISDDTHVWSEVYDSDMSEVFRVQSDVAERVAQALDITLLEPERVALAAKATDNVEAYEYYLRGNDYFFRAEAETNFRIAIRMYEKAIELDPTFSLAYTKLSEAHLVMYWMFYDRSEERLALAKQALDKALELNPHLPEVHMSLGWYYYNGCLDYDRALEEFAIAQKSQPNNSDLLLGIGAVQRRQGKFEQALMHIKRAYELDPRSAMIARNLGDTYMLLRNYPEAERYYDRAISLSPDWPAPYARKAMLYVLSEGSTKKAAMVLEDELPKIGSSDDSLFILVSILVDIFDGKYQEALAQLSSGTLEILESQFFFIPKSQLYALINGLMGNRQLEKTYYESARSILESKIHEDPNDARFHSSLGIVYAGLRLEDDAIREGKLAVKLLPITKDGWIGTFRIEDLARIYTMVGEYDLAIEQLEYLMGIPGEISISLLQIDPAWKPLHNYPRFQKLLESAK